MHIVQQQAQSHENNATIPSAALLYRKVRRLGIAHAEFAACATIGDLQVLVKHRYRLLIKAYHPDTPRRRALPDHTPTPITDGEPTKRCGRCKHDKSLKDFTRHRSKPDGLQPYCRACNYLLHHPERHGHAPGPAITKGVMFQHLTDAYRAIMALPASEPILARQSPVVPREPLPFHETPLPWAMDRKTLVLGFGWQETHL